MKKLLFVDDEPVTVKGLKMLTDYECLGIEIIGEAYNGETALDLIVRSKPDIIITDVWMPVMDGIELMKKINEMHLNVNVIVLSGYSQFEYAKQALKYGAFDYLLKPVEADQLAAVLKKAIQRIDAEEKNKEILKKAKFHLNESISVVKEKFYNDLTHNAMGFEDAKDKAEILGITLHNTEFAVLLVNIDNYCHNPEFKTEKDRNLLKFAVSNIVEEIVSSEDYGISTVFGRNICTLLNPARGKLSEIKIFDIARRIEQCTTRYLKEPVSIGIGNVAANIPAVAESFRNAQIALTYGILSENERIMHYCPSKQMEKSRGVYQRDTEKELFNALEDGTCGEDSKACGNLIKEFISASGSNPAAMYYFCKQFYMDLSIFLRDFGGNQEEISDRLDHIYGQLSDIISLYDLEKWLTEIVSAANAYICEKKNEHGDSIVSMVKAYINNNYEKELSLNSLAEHIHMNPSYFSNFFRNKSGETLTDYITRVRMENAAKLLRNTDKKTYEISDMVGFKNVRYFNYVFKSSYGLSPTEYKSKITAKT